MEAFYISLLLCSHIGDHPQGVFAKFGYRLDMKVENMLRIIFYFGYLLCDDIYVCKNVLIQNMAKLGPLFDENHLHVLKSYFFQLKTIKNFAPQKKKNVDVILRAELPGCLTLNLKVLKPSFQGRGMGTLEASQVIWPWHLQH